MHSEFPSELSSKKVSLLKKTGFRGKLPTRAELLNGTGFSVSGGGYDTPGCSPDFAAEEAPGFNGFNRLPTDLTALVLAGVVTSKFACAWLAASMIWFC